MTTRLRGTHLALLLLGAQLCLALSALPAWSVTFDEFLHVAVAWYQWTTGDLTHDPWQPPFRRLLFGAPVAALFPRLHLTPVHEDTLTGWGLAHQFMADNYARYREVFLLARLLVVGLSLLLSWLVYRAARARWGEAAGLLALALAAFCPNLLANGRLATLDLAMALLTFAAVAAFVRLRRTPTLPWILLLGALLGAAQTSKASGVLLHPTFLLVALPTLPGDAPRRRRLGAVAAAGLVSLLATSAAYSFAPPAGLLGGARLASPQLRALAARAPWLPVPVPAAYLDVFDRQLTDKKNYVYFFHGEASTAGSRWYFVLGPLLKATVPALLLAAWGLGAAVRRRDREALLHLVAPSAVLWASLVGSDAKNQTRYLLPAVPFAYVLAGGALFGSPSRRATAAAALLAAWHAGEAVRTHPHALSYFNPLAGGARGGLEWLSGSDLDWGQDLPALARWMREHRVPEVQLAYYGRVDPALYGVRYRLLRGRGQPGYAAVSAAFLQGIPNTVLREGAVVPGPQGQELDPSSIVGVPQGYYTWLRAREPVALLGGSIYVFRLP